jgi:hypothetical protein
VAAPKCCVFEENPLYFTVKGGRSPAKRTLEGRRNADTLQGLGLVADFRSQPPSPSGGEDFPALGGGVRGGAQKPKEKCNNGKARCYL